MKTSITTLRIQEIPTMLELKISIFGHLLRQKRRRLKDSKILSHLHSTLRLARESMRRNSLLPLRRKQDLILTEARNSLIWREERVLNISQTLMQKLEFMLTIILSIRRKTLLELTKLLINQTVLTQAEERLLLLLLLKILNYLGLSLTATSIQMTM